MVRDAVAAASAAISALEPAGSGVFMEAGGTHELGIARVGFVLIDLASEQPANVVDRADVRYEAPLPAEVTETWTSGVPLVSGGTYRAFFHIYDRTGVNLVAYDRRDFIAPWRKENGNDTDIAT